MPLSVKNGRLTFLSILAFLTAFAEANGASVIASSLTPLTGLAVASVRYREVWQGGSPPWFHIVKGDYWKDLRGHKLPWNPSLSVATGGRQHHFTRLILREMSVSLPVSPGVAGVFAVLVVVIVAVVLACWMMRRGECEADASGPLN